MNHLEAIAARISRRKYSNETLKAEEILKFDTWIEAINQKSDLSIALLPDGSQAFNGLSKSYGMFSGVRSLLVLKGKANDPHLLEKCGYYGEQLVLEATKLGLGTCWVAGTYDNQSPIFNCKADEKIVCVIPVGRVAPEKSFGEKLIYKLSHRKTKAFEDFYTADGTPEAWFLKGIEAVQKAPSAMNTQKVHLTCQNHKVHIAVPNTYQMDMIDLGIAKYHFEVVTGRRFELGNKAALTER